MPEYSSTTITPADGVKTPAMNGSTSGNYTLSALRDFILASKGQANGLASLDANGKLPSSQLPDLADDVIVVASYASLLATGTAGKIYITADNNKMYRWDPDLATPDYVELSIDLSEYARIVDIQDGNIQAGVAVKAFQDAMGRAIITTYATKADLQDGTLEPLISTKSRQDQNGNVIDQTYETKAEASDLKSAIQANSNRISNLEENLDPTGAYKTVNYRGTNDVPTGKAKYALVESIVGKSRAWNQLVKNGNLETSSNWDCVSCLYDNGKFKSNGTSSPWVYQSGFSLIAGHKYLISFKIKSSVATTNTRIQIWDSVLGYFYLTTNNALSANNYLTLSSINTVASDKGGSYRLYIYQDDGIIVSANETFEFEILLRDLTPILSDWNSTDITTANIPLMVQQIPDLLKYDPYGYSLVDTVVEGVKSVSNNLFDDDWLLLITGWANDGTYYYGEPSNDRTSFQAKLDAELNPKIKGKRITISCKGKVASSGLGTIIRVYYTDSTNDMININQTSETSFSVTSNPNKTVDYIYFSYGTNIVTYIKELQVEIGANATSYSPYGTLDTLTLPTPVTLRSAGSVADTDELNVEVLVDGVKVKKRRQTTRIGSYTFTGNETPTASYQRTNGDWYCIFQSIFNDGKNGGEGLSDKGIPFTTGNDAYNGTGTYFVIRGEGGVAFYLAGATSVSVVTAWISANLPKIYYELSDESVTLLDPIENNTIQTEGGGTINTIQTQTPVIDNSMDVGYLAL